MNAIESAAADFAPAIDDDVPAGGSLFLKPLHVRAKICLGLETAMPHVRRFKRYGAENFALREQNDAEHLISVKYVAICMTLKFQASGAIFDRAMVLEAFDIHDHGEGAIGIDTDYIDKTDNQDLKEYRAFMNLIAKEDLDARSHLQRLFLLQTALANPECFPPDARKIMADLSEHHAMEAVIFDAIQRWDYLYYPLQEFLAGHGENAMVRTVRNQIASYREFAEAIPGFRRHYFTSEAEAEMEAMIRANEGKFEGNF